MLKQINSLIPSHTVLPWEPSDPVGDLQPSLSTVAPADHLLLWSSQSVFPVALNNLLQSQQPSGGFAGVITPVSSAGLQLILTVGQVSQRERMRMLYDLDVCPEFYCCVFVDHLCCQDSGYTFWSETAGRFTLLFLSESLRLPKEMPSPLPQKLKWGIREYWLH